MKRSVLTILLLSCMALQACARGETSNSNGNSSGGAYMGASGGF